ncbi:hypothetical protein [Lysobacter gummosus]|uniref:hypothetical protein n=1 Tax=Lysobacter gummosus TaxID=262324 RepID=UPI0036393212
MRPCGWSRPAKSRTARPSCCFSSPKPAGCWIEVESIHAGLGAAAGAQAAATSRSARPDCRFSIAIASSSSAIGSSDR